MQNVKIKLQNKVKWWIKMFKKIFILFILALYPLYISSCNKKEDTYVKNYGTFYSVEEAYKGGLINYEELLSLAFYQNKGTSSNEKIMGEHYTPISIMPTQLEEEMIHKIKATKATTKKEYDSFEVYDYFGTYDGAIAIKIKSSLSDIPAVVTKIIVDGILFVYPTYTMCLWKELH